MAENPRNERTNPPTRFLRLPEVMARTGLSRSTIYVRLAAGRFPRPVALGGRAVGWIEAEIEEWVAERIAESRFDGVETRERGEAAHGIPEAGWRAAGVRQVR
ncbi:MAG: AlpA family transcriptional regulator [Gemmatimonadales bacterium]|nr:AlpA family transcriptional regulator [Candidatus Palauibacter irciniicola]MYC51565.1 AlpA family transcriptional regulator [Gammaproteobacteria bacterium]